LIKRSKFVIELGFCAGLFALLCVRTLAYQYTHTHQIGFADDAFYYFVVAQHLVRDGKSTFDGFTFTNGYHPLWMALVTLQYKLFGQSLLLTRCLEFFLGEVALVFTLLLVRLPKLSLSLFFTAGFFFVLNRVSFNGMETALFACCFCLYTYVSIRRLGESRVAGAIEGLLAAAVIASRIDSVVFVLPQMFLIARSWTRRGAALAMVLLCGIGYVSANRLYFGIGLPISGEVKSLGGLQINRALFHFLERPYNPSVQLCYATVVLCIVAFFLLRRPQPYVHRSVMIAFLVGYAVFALRLAFLSSWVIWNWYDYPLFIGYIACIPSLLVMCAEYLEQRRLYAGLVPAAAVVLVAILLIGSIRTRNRPLSSMQEDVPAANGDVSNIVSTTLAGARVAMGDRAGSFAYHYTGSVNQLEGIMNDARYLRALRTKTDVRQLLCERDIRYVVAYEPDLNSYKMYFVHTIRPELSQYAAPEILVSRSDQVLRTPAVSPGEPLMKYLYIWRLSCGAAEGSYTELGSNYPPATPAQKRSIDQSIATAGAGDRSVR
jgi:hypothetical protein